ncbi:MAG TPA: tetratricopeptide repeat protein [Kofleriaceae bacterium]|nr:tetratricopeptide repeat protein [Kofleriaceae bacterium]
MKSKLYVPHVMARLVALALILATGVLVLSARPACADELTDQAKRDVAAGLAAQKAGHYDEAIALYKKAFDAIPHPEIVFDLGQAYRLKGDAETALGYYRRYLAVEPNGRVARDARHWVAELRKQLARHDGHSAGAGQPPAAATSVSPAPGTGPASATAGAGVAVGTSAGSASSPGSPAGSASSPGSPVGSAPAISTGPAGDRGAPGTAAPLPARPAAALRVTSPQPAASSDHRMVYTLVAAGAGGASLIGGLVFGGLARSKRNAAIKICGTDHQCDSASDLARADALLAQSRTRGTVSTVLVITGASGLVISGALWLSGRRYEGSRIAVAPVVSRDAVGLGFGTVF